MDVSNPSDWAQGAGAVKNGVEMLRGVWALVKEFQGEKRTPDQERIVEQAFGEASKAAQIAEAQMAKALGFELCLCEFPPTAMLQVGYISKTERGGGSTTPVYECPSCAYRTSGPFAFTRTKTLELVYKI
jgi:hypothetical protein